MSRKLPSVKVPSYLLQMITNYLRGSLVTCEGDAWFLVEEMTRGASYGLHFDKHSADPGECGVNRLIGEGKAGGFSAP